MNSPWFHGWNVLALTVVFQAVSYGIAIYCFALYVVPWKNEFNVSVRDIMISISALQFSIGLQSAFVGRVLDSFSPRSLVITGGLLLAVGLVLISRATALWQIILLFATLVSTALVLTGPVMSQTLIMRWFTTKKGLAIGISAMGTSLGGLLFPVISSTLIVSSGWRHSLLIHAGIAVPVICVFGWFVLRKQPPAQVPLQTSAMPDPSAVSDTHEWTSAEMLRSAMLWIPVIAFIPLIAAYSGVQFNLGAYLQTAGLGADETAFLISIVALSMLVGKIAFGLLADMVDHRWLYWGAVIALCSSLAMYQGEPGLLQIRIGTFFLGVAGGAYIPLSGVIIGSLFGVVSFGRAIGLFTMFMTLGTFGPVLAGWIYDASGSFDAVFSTFIYLLIPPAVLMLSLNKFKLNPRTRP